MKLRHLGAAVAVLLSAAACNSFLDVKPVAELPRQQALTGPTSARAAVAGMYDALQDNTGQFYYSGDRVLFTDLSSDDVTWTGTFTTYADAEDNNLRSDNGDVRGMWNSMYSAVARANLVLEQMPNISGIDAEEKDQFLGEAHFIRALAYHDLVTIWGGLNTGDPGVPLVLTTVSDAASSASLTRATVGAVYTQILADLTQAEALMSASIDDPSRATVGAVVALRARVELFRKNYAAAESLSTVVEGMGYDLAPNYADLFTADGKSTSEDIFKLTFSAVDADQEGYYYLGRTEVEPSDALGKAYQPTYVIGDPSSWNPTDLRAQVNIAADPDFEICGYDLCGTKYPTTIGAEDIHIIRFAEVVLTKAEAMARQGGAKLVGAVAEVNKIRERAGLLPLTFGVGPVTTQQQVIDEVMLQRRLELAMEGHRWMDLVRTGLVLNFLSNRTDPAPSFQQLYPIPSRELSVSPNIVQNPGYSQ